MPVISPGYAFTSEFERQIMSDQDAAMRAQEFRLRQQQEQRQAAAQVEELRQGQEALQIRRDEANRTIRDDLRNQTIADVKMLRMGDIPDPELVERARRFHVPLRMAPMGSVLEQAPPTALTAPGQETLPQSMTGQNAPRIGPAPGAVLGTPEEERKAQTDIKRAEYARKLATAKPGSDEERQILIDAAINEGHMPTAAELGGQKDTATQQKEHYMALYKKSLLGQPLTPAESADMRAYERATTLTAQASAGAASGRQFTSEDFQMRKDGLDKIEKVNEGYSKGSAKAQSIIDVVNAAKAGNKEAGGVQNLLLAFGLTGVEGLNRVNMPEIQTVSGVGDILTRMRSRLRMMTQGQVLTPELQNDAIELAKILQKTQYSNYKRQFNSTKKLYGLGTDVEPLEESVLPGTSTETPEDRRQRLLEEYRRRKD